MKLLGRFFKRKVLTDYSSEIRRLESELAQLRAELSETRKQIDGLLLWKATESTARNDQVWSHEAYLRSIV